MWAWFDQGRWNFESDGYGVVTATRIGEPAHALEPEKFVYFRADREFTVEAFIDGRSRKIKVGGGFAPSPGVIVEKLFYLMLVKWELGEHEFGNSTIASEPRNAIEHCRMTTEEIARILPWLSHRAKKRAASEVNYYLRLTNNHRNFAGLRHWSGGYKTDLAFLGSDHVDSDRKHLDEMLEMWQGGCANKNK